MYYLCDEHETAYEVPNQVRAHWGFQHRSKAPDLESIQSETLPDGYKLSKFIPGKYTRPKAGGDMKPVGAPPQDKPLQDKPLVDLPLLERNPDAQRLGKMLSAIGVDPHDVNTIINGYINLPQIRDDPNYLSHWLDTHISDRKLKAYIPMVVNDVFVPGTATTLLPGAFPQPGPAAPMYGPHYSTQQPVFYPQYPGFQVQPPPQSPRPDGRDEVTERLAALDKRLDVFMSLQQKREEERERTERERALTDKIEKLSDTVRDLFINQDRKKVEEESKQSQGFLGALLEEIKELKTSIADQRHEELKREMDVVKQRVSAVGQETTGRTAEDLAYHLGPTVAEKFDKMGDRVVSELKGLREQAFPIAKAQAERATAVKTIDEIQEEATIENQILGEETAWGAEQEQGPVQGEAATGTEPVEEDEAFARLPNPNRGRRGQQQ